MVQKDWERHKYRPMIKPSYLVTRELFRTYVRQNVLLEKLHELVLRTARVWSFRVETDKTDVISNALVPKS